MRTFNEVKSTKLPAIDCKQKRGLRNINMPRFGKLPR